MIFSESKHKFINLMISGVIALAGLYGCSDNATNQINTDNLSFSSMSSADSAGDAQSILILDTVKILIKDIKLNVSGGSQDSANFITGPYVLFLNLTSNINFIGSAIIPAGTYDKIKFEVHKLNDNEAVPDPEFADENGRYSVVIKGRYSGSYFVYKSSKSAHQILNFPNTISVSPESKSNITMLLKPYIWFIRDGIYLDPRIPANSNDIDNNIKDNINHNFKAFRDDDKNGLPD